MLDQIDDWAVESIEMVQDLLYATRKNKQHLASSLNLNLTFRRVRLSFDSWKILHDFDGEKMVTGASKKGPVRHSASMNQFVQAMGEFHQAAN